MPDYYDILQVSPTAEPEVIEAAYRRLARKYHPDVYQGPDANARMRALNEAFEVLRDPERRRQYDSMRGGGQRSERKQSWRESHNTPPKPPHTGDASKRWRGRRVGLWLGGLAGAGAIVAVVLLARSATESQGRGDFNAVGASGRGETSSATTRPPLALTTTPRPTPQGDPPGDPATQAIDRLVLAASLPTNVGIHVRRDATNESESERYPQLLQRFKDTGRETGVQYTITIDGKQRISLGVNRYTTAAGAKHEFEMGKPQPEPGNRIEVRGLGDDYGAGRVTIRQEGTLSYVHNITFVRGPYYVTLADFVPDMYTTANVASAVARALDEALKKAE